MNERKKSRILVFRNGSGTGPIEVVVDRDDFQGVSIKRPPNLQACQVKLPSLPPQLLDCCTARLDIGSCARRIFLWDGSEVENLHEVPEIHRLVAASSGTPVLGPVWVAKAEGFSPSGCEVFLLDVIRAMLEKLKTANTYREQVLMNAKFTSLCTFFFNVFFSLLLFCLFTSSFSFLCFVIRISSYSFCTL